MSRYPHLSAIGFVWNPLPSLDRDSVYVAESILATVENQLIGRSGAKRPADGGRSNDVARHSFRSRGGRRWWRWLAVAGFTLHPVIVTYGQSGLSESGEIICSWAIRYLLKA